MVEWMSVVGKKKGKYAIQVSEVGETSERKHTEKVPQY